ncbi:MAG: peptidoglycan-binding protein [Cereibacter sphaeroides]|uniref:Peptidoglycan-binding protein n=1 Tax=Cereibacter sphaeroides TaxID=1063 RepID=A0A2W5UCK2_CERSP|nr:MAG: peptidoglycan-binding protein [Cereibacter sphaeroides]
MGWLVLVLVTAFGAAGQAQDNTWVQIEAQPTLAEAKERAEAYASAFPDVAGFALRSGWFGIVLGPYASEEAQTKLTDLKRERLIPSDSFIAYGRDFRDRFWPDETQAPTPELQITEPVPEATATSPLQDETPEQARATEAALDKEERQELQTALQWFGFYASSIDGAIGPGTRTAMAAWQEANAAEPTGVLTTRQRDTLVGAHKAAVAELGLQKVSETEAGIEIDLPMAMIAFDRYEPPFARFSEKDGSGVSVLLISQPGDEPALRGLYDFMQTLQIVPLEGERSRTERSFEIQGRNGEIESFTHVELAGGLIKGYTLVWPVGNGGKMERVLAAMESSFRPLGDRALDPGLAPMDDAQREGMLSGLEVRKPILSRSGFFIDATGTVLTTPDVLQSCARVTIDGDQEMKVRLSDTSSGLAVLTPDRPLSPPAVASFQRAAEPAGAEVAVAGYPFEGELTSPTLTFGLVEALQGLDGEPGLKRLSLPAKTGDAGGPVVDGTGAVVGMLLPRTKDGTRILPPDVTFAATAEAIEARLLTEGITLNLATQQGALPPEDLTRRATGMTVLVSCWD